MNNIEKDQSIKNIERRVIGNQINLFTAVSMNTAAPITNKFSSRGPNSTNARFASSMRVDVSNLKVSGKDMAAHQKIHMMNDDPLN